MFAALRKLRSNEAMRGINWEQNNLCDSRLESPQTLRSSVTLDSNRLRHSDPLRL
jgi:hypothetical protein